MFKKIFFISFLFSIISCKKDTINCDEKFGNLYIKRYSFWVAFDRIGVTSNDNFSREQYTKLRKQVNDSMSIMIDCALEQNKNSEILYLYKMKQLFLVDKLNEVEPFLKTVDRKIVKDDIYFQLSLYSLLCKELLTGHKPVEEYKNLLKSYSPKLNPVYNERAHEEFLNYLIDDNLEEFEKKMLKRYPTTSDMSMEYGDNRLSIIKEMMMRGDNLIFD